MAVTTLQRRMTSRNRRTAYIAKIGGLTGADVYLSTFRDPFGAFTTPVNPIIVGLTGLSVSDITKVSNIKIAVLNNKVNRQVWSASGPVKFSDLMAEGLDKATIELKALIWNAAPVTANSFSSATLVTIFKGQIRPPFSYQDDRITLGATVEEDNSDIDYPVEVIGETGGLDPRKERNRIPILVGNCSAEEIAPGISFAPATAPAGLYDDGNMVLILSSLPLADLQHITVQAGQFPPAPFDESHFWPDYTEDEHPDYTFQQLGYGPIWGRLTIYPVLRMNAKSFITVAPTYDHDDIGPENTQVSMAPGESLGVMVPPVTDSGGTDFGYETAWSHKYHLDVYIHVALPVPPGLQLRVDRAWKERKGHGASYSKYYGVLTPSDLRGECLKVSPISNFIGYIINDTPYGHDAIMDWGFFRTTSGFRVQLQRQDSNPEPLIIKGLYVQLRAHFGYIDENEFGAATGGQFGVAAKGIPVTGSEPERYHPSNVIKATMTDVLGISSGDIDFGGLGDFTGTEGWQFGYSLHGAQTADTILKNLTTQMGARLVRDPDGIYRLRLKARYGARPTSQRYDQALRFGVEVTGVPLIEPQGKAAVKNVIVVDYQEIADDTYQRTAWVNDQDSDNGFGYSSPDAEIVSHTSIVTNGYYPRRYTLKGWAIRDKGTAVGVRDYYLSRGAAPPSKVTIPVGAIGADLRVGLFVRLDAATMDQVVLYNGTTWTDKWFEIEDIRKVGDGYSLKTISVPTTEIAQVAMVPRRVMVVP